MQERLGVPPEVQTPDLVLRQQIQHSNDHRVVPSALTVSLGSLSPTSARPRSNAGMEPRTGVHLPRVNVRPLTSSATANEVGDSTLRQISKEFVKANIVGCDSNAAHHSAGCSQYEQTRRTTLHAVSTGESHAKSARENRWGPGCGDKTDSESVRVRCDNMNADTQHIMYCQSTAGDSSCTDGSNISRILWSPIFMCAITLSIFIASIFLLYEKVCSILESRANHFDIHRHLDYLTT